MFSRAVIERAFASRVDQRVLRWFGHVERMYEYCVVKKDEGGSKWRAGTG